MSEKPNRCQQCHGDGSQWLLYEGVYWTVKDVAYDDNGRLLCAFCRRHPHARVRATRFGQPQPEETQ